MDLARPGSVFVNQAWSFPRPVHVGDPITATGTVTTARPSRGFYQMRFEVQNEDDEAMLTGEATVFRASPPGR